MFGDDVERLYYLHPLTGEVVREVEEVFIFPATHYAAGPERMERAIRGIEKELEERLAELNGQNKLLEAQRLQMRTAYDIEMMRQVGFCSGIENYSMHIDGRERGSAPNCLLDYFPEDFLLVIDESHVTVPADRRHVRGRHVPQADARRARLPAAVGDGQPAAEVRGVHRADRARRSTCPRRRATTSWAGRKGEFVEQVIRPTGLVDPQIVVKPTKGQIDDLVGEIRERAERNERVLVTTLTKKMSEDLTDYLLELGIRVRYLHSEVDTLRRVELLRELRLGEYDVLVGINLLREGLDLPEVSLVSILDADKEGFLRSGTSLIQTIGRAARNVSGQVHMYADTDHPVDADRDRGDEPPPREAGRLQHRTRDRPDAAAQADRRHHRPAPARGRRHRRAARARPRSAVRSVAVARQVGGAGTRRPRRARRASSASARTPAAGSTSPRCRARNSPT